MTTRKARHGLGKRVAALVLLAAAAASIAFATRGAPGFLGSAWRLARGRAAYERGDWAESDKAAREVLKTDPKNQGALQLLARSLARSGRDERAIEVYQRLGPSALESQDYLLLGDGFSKLGQETLSISSWLNAERLAPGDPQLLARLARYYYEVGRPFEALSRSRKLASDPALGLRGAWLEARIRSDLDEPESASPLLDRALAADDPSLHEMGIERADAVSLAARVNLRLGRPDRALEILDFPAGVGRDRDSRWLVSRALLQQGKASEAAAAIEAVVPPKSPLAREPAPYTGAESCRRCHASNYESQQSSRHAQTFHDRWDGPTSSGSEDKIVDPARPRVHHRLKDDGGATTLETTVADRTYSAIVQFVVGSGNHGQTLMVKDGDGQFRESRISYQPARDRWSKTINHSDSPPEALDYLGRAVSAEGVWSCVHCHATTASAKLSPSPIRPHDRSIGCERCHGPGGNHIKAVELGLDEVAIATPSLATAAEVTNLCAECHREPSPGAFTNSPSFIRFQAPTFMKSRCYVESGTFSCVSCHNPHKDAETSPAVYEAVCLRCHSTTGPTPSSPRAEEKAGLAAICPVNPTKDCLSCHMPKIPKAVPGAEFTDHFIRVRKDVRSAGSQTAPGDRP
jgi:tetratricopeptide (TPR) repeat protein